jgi:hypothetical protein
MCVWQSQAPDGLAKLTAVAGCEALAYAVRIRANSAAAPKASRLVSMELLDHI